MRHGMGSLARAAACVALSVFALGACSAQAETGRLSFFAVAHQDDWQLFMNPGAYYSLDEPHERAVFIHITAGDAGNGDGGDAPVPYFAAREEGAIRAIRFMVNAAREPEPGLGTSAEMEAVEVNGHVIHRYTYANTAAYFLRLPDGSGEGMGYETTGWQSLEALRVGAISDIRSVDGKTEYSSRKALVETLQAILQLERQGNMASELHIHETNQELNPGDHFDHRNASLLMQEAADNAPFCIAVYHHDSYDTRGREINIEGTDLMIDAGTWAATASGLGDGYANSTWEPVHNSWVGRSYNRQVDDRGICE